MGLTPARPSSTCRQGILRAVLEKLSPARRVLLIVALVLLVFPSGGFSYRGSGQDLHVIEFDFHFWGGPAALPAAHAGNRRPAS